MVIRDSGEVSGFGSGGDLRLREMMKLPPLTRVSLVDVDSTRGIVGCGDFLGLIFLFGARWLVCAGFVLSLDRFSGLV